MLRGETVFKPWRHEHKRAKKLANTCPEQSNKGVNHFKMDRKETKFLAIQAGFAHKE